MSTSRDGRPIEFKGSIVQCFVVTFMLLVGAVAMYTLYYKFFGFLKNGRIVGRGNYQKYN